jgi:hypothetical protein
MIENNEENKFQCAMNPLLLSEVKESSNAQVGEREDSKLAWGL